MRILLLTLIVYLAAVIETSLVDLMRIGPVAPDLLALVAVIWLLVSDRPRVLLAAGAIALMGDLIAPGRVGLGMAWMLLVGYVVVRLRARFKVEHLFWQLLITWLAVTLWAFGLGLTGRVLGDVALPVGTILARAAGVGLYTAGVSLPVLMILGWVRQPHLARQKRLTEF